MRIPASDLKARASFIAACATALLFCTASRAESISTGSAPPKPEIEAAGMIKVFGDSLHGTMSRLEQGFQRHNPGIRFANTPLGSECGFAGLYTGCGDIAPLADPPTRDNYMAFFETNRYNPTEIVIASGGFASLPPPIIVANADNPIAQLTMGQLDRIFSAERIGTWRPLVFTGDFARGPETNIRTWGQLGLTGDWAAKPIQTYGWVTRTGAAFFFEERVFHGSIKWNGNYREYAPAAGSADGKTAGNPMLDALSRDKYGIGWTTQVDLGDYPHLRTLALAERDAGPYVAPTPENLRSRAYPLTRNVSIYFKQPPAGPVDPNVREFLRFALSREGQQIIASAGTYYPLPDRKLREETSKLR